MPAGIYLFVFNTTKPEKVILGFFFLLWTRKYRSFNKYLSEAYSEPYQASEMKLFAKMVKVF